LTQAPALPSITASEFYERQFHCRLTTTGGHQHDEAMGHHAETSSRQQRANQTPSSGSSTLIRLVTVREWWYEMDEPVEVLADP
jgi:hypothetical protein